MRARPTWAIAGVLMRRRLRHPPAAVMIFVVPFIAALVFAGNNAVGFGNHFGFSSRFGRNNVVGGNVAIANIFFQREFDKCLCCF